MATSKSKKSKSSTETCANNQVCEDIASSAELKTFLQSVLDRMTDGQVAPIFSFSALNYLLSNPSTNKLFSLETKELARDIWLRIKQSGVQVRNPVFLFGKEADSLV